MLCIKAGWVNLTSWISKKTHKMIHDFARPREPLLDDPSINRGSWTLVRFMDIILTRL